MVPGPLCFHLLDIILQHTLDFVAHNASFSGRGIPSVILTVHRDFGHRLGGTGVFLPEALSGKEDGAMRSIDTGLRLR